MEQHLSLLLSRHPWLALLVQRALKIVVIIAIVFVCAKLIHLLSSRILDMARRAKLGKSASGTHDAEHEKRLSTLVRLIDATLRVLLFVAAGLMILRELGLDITPFLTGAGIAGVAVGFGAQSLVRDVISGFFILIEDQIRVGDVIKINNGLGGTVERMELRVTAIRDGDGTLHIIPNGEIKSVSNLTYDFSQAVVDIPIRYQTDLPKLAATLTAVVDDFEKDPAWKGELRAKPEFLGIVKFEPGYMVVQIVAKASPHGRWAMARELRARAKRALDEAGILLAAA